MSSSTTNFLRSEIVVNYVGGSIGSIPGPDQTLSICSEGEGQQQSHHHDDVIRILRKINCTREIKLNRKKSKFGIEVEIPAGNAASATLGDVESIFRKIDIIVQEGNRREREGGGDDDDDDDLNIPEATPERAAPFPPYATRPGNPYSECCANGICHQYGKDKLDYCCHWKIRCNDCFVDYSILHQQAVVDTVNIPESKKKTTEEKKKKKRQKRKAKQNKNNTAQQTNTTPKQQQPQYNSAREALDEINKCVERGDLQAAINVEQACKDTTGAWIPSIRNGSGALLKKLRKKLTEIRNTISSATNKRTTDAGDDFNCDILASLDLATQSGTKVQVDSISFSSEDVISISFGYRILLWDIQKELSQTSSSSSRLLLETADDVQCTSFSMEQPRLLAVGGTFSVEVYQIDMSTKTHTKLFREENPFNQQSRLPQFYPGPGVCCVQFVPNQSNLLVASCKEDNLLRIWDFQQKQLLWSYGVRVYHEEYQTNVAYASLRQRSQLTFDSTGSFLFYSNPAGMDVQIFELGGEENSNNLHETHLVTTVSLGQPIASMAFSTLGDYLTIVTSSLLHKANLFRFFPDLPPEQKLARGPVHDFASESSHGVNKIDQVIAIPASRNCMVYSTVTNAALLEMDFPGKDKGYIRAGEDAVSISSSEVASTDEEVRGILAASPSIPGVFATAINGTVSLCQLGPNFIGMASWNVAKVVLSMISKPQEDSSINTLSLGGDAFLFARILSFAFPHSNWLGLVAKSQEVVNKEKDRDIEEDITAVRLEKSQYRAEKRKRLKAQKLAGREERQLRHKQRMAAEYQKFWEMPGETVEPLKKSHKDRKKSPPSPEFGKKSKLADTQEYGVPEKLAEEGTFSLSTKLQMDANDPRWKHTIRRMQERNISLEEIQEAIDYGTIVPDYAHYENHPTRGVDRKHRWKFYHDETGVTVVTDHWVESTVTSWKANYVSIPRREVLQGEDASVCCSGVQQGRCALCRDHCHD